MVPNQALNAYKQTEGQVAEVHPVKLIHLMYERVLVHLEFARTGMRENDPRKRGENLGKAIALISELNASVKSDDQSEAARFLRGLYSAILLELAKVPVVNDEEVLVKSHAYVKRLKEIWEETAMREHGLWDREPVRSPGEYGAGARVAGSAEERGGRSLLDGEGPSGLSVSI